MASDNLQYAPQPKLVDGLFGVPMDIQTIDAHVVFDGSTSTATGDATLTYLMGGQDGCPIFDLRQTITSAWLDGVPIAPTLLAHHDFGGGPNADLRIVAMVQTAHSAHTLRVQYAVGVPQTDVAGNYTPHVVWDAGPRLRFNFGFTDLRPSRYLEAFIPANLIYDQFQLTIEIDIQNTAIAHSVITNGAVTSLGANHWSISFPDRFSALSTLLDVRATDTVTLWTDLLTLPVSGNVVTIEGWKLNTDMATDLVNSVNNIKAYLSTNENDVGPYLHGSRYVAFLSAGGMEYEGGTTSVPASLRHETYHSWWARGVKPARQQDGWWDEGWDVYHDNGSMGATPFNFANPPIELCSQNEWQRVTASNAYGDGEAFWEGVAALLGVATLKSLMREFYSQFKGRVAATYDFEAFLLCKTGNAQLVNAFHRFAYGFTTPVPVPDLWLRDEIGDPGNNAWAGRFWDSPDLWVRNADDGSSVHQNPEYGQDNWIYARVRNRSPSATAQHFAVAFQVKTFAGTQFSYPADFLPCAAAVVGFNLSAGQSTVLKARWPTSLVPPAGTHACLLASVLTPGDFPAIAAHAWEHNNLAQKNLTIIDLRPNEFIVIPFVVPNLFRRVIGEFALQLIPHQKFIPESVSLIRSDGKLAEKRRRSRLAQNAKNMAAGQLSDCGQQPQLPLKDWGWITADDSPRFAELFADRVEMPFTKNSGFKMPIDVQPTEQHVYGLKVIVPPNAVIGEVMKFDLAQVDRRSGKILGGIAAEIRVR
ncbi:MAG: hypothetical protein HY067_23235 [Betaproteobacteria bacterium]|nr:hypothetical protein [Betaproteobacteria bacterium]